TDPDYHIFKLRQKEGLLPLSLIPETIDEVPSIFHEAAKRGNIEQLKQCLEYCIPVNCLDASNSTALHWAAAFGQAGDTPLHNASWRNYPLIIKMLIEAGADQTIQNKAGKTALNLATHCESKAVLKKRD
ncbi:hypothetical protein HZS_7083, partial [Henneguya salminicola]